MVSKIKKVVILFSIITFLIGSTAIFAISNDQNNSNNSIVSVSSQSVKENTDFYLILNLSNVSYTKFKVEITNTSSLKSSEINPNNVSDVSTNSGNTSFVVDKTSIGLDKIGIIYTSGKAGDKIDFQVTITDLDNTVATMQAQVNTLTTEIDGLTKKLANLNSTLGSLTEDDENYEEISNEIDSTNSDIASKQNEQENLNNQISSYTEKISETTSVEVETTSNDDNKSAWGDDMNSLMKDKMQEMDMENEKMSMNMKEMMSKMSNLETDLTAANSKITELTQSNVYQGSQNNYLKTLSISNVELNTEFKKTTSNYFATVGKDVSSVTVNATAEDSSSVVTIYGNTNLEEGKNKIIISVTSENGNVRNYKIYVTK
jgi:uncharacterized coiled-coil protein SlyX